MTIDERVEAVIAAQSLEGTPEEREGIREMILDAFAEVYGATPAAWIAPWEPTPEMTAAARRNSPTRVFVACRDTYLQAPNGG